MVANYQYVAGMGQRMSAPIAEKAGSSGLVISSFIIAISGAVIGTAALVLAIIALVKLSSVNTMLLGERPQGFEAKTDADKHVSAAKRYHQCRHRP